MILNISVICVAVLLIAGVAFAQPATQPASSALAFNVKDVSGKDINLADKFAGKVVLIVNVASKCGYTPQYKDLEDLHEALGAKGLSIVAFPCNQFKNQEPGSIQEIVEFCEKTYQVKFNIFDKVDVNGANAIPLYKYLTSDAAPIQDKGEVKWNFEKFLVGKDGKLIARYRSAINPQMIRKDIEEALAK